MKKASAEVDFVSLAAGASFETEAKSDASMLFLVKPKERLIWGVGVGGSEVDPRLLTGPDSGRSVADALTLMLMNC